MNNKKLTENQKIKKSNIPKFTIWHDGEKRIFKIENKTDILFHGVWIQVILNPRLKTSKYDHKLKKIHLKENRFNEILHELTHALHYEKHDLLMKKIDETTKKGDTSSEYLALFIELYAESLLDWSAKIKEILR